MNTKQTCLLIVSLCLAFACCLPRAAAQGTTTTTAAPASTDDVTALQKFIVEETANTGGNTLMQNSRPVDSVLFTDMNVMDIPRAVTVLTPEAMQQYGVIGFEDLDKVGAGMTKPFTFGISGAPFIRGDFGGVYIDGMRRLYNANDTPVSFGSMESMDIVKGPAPAQYGPSNAGGYVNLIPKTPYFDQFRGSVDFTYGAYNLFNTQVDVGGPQLLFDKPMAYRISITDQQADSYYNAVKDNYISVFASMKMKLSDNIKLTTGSEYFNYHSNENAGWNRATQDEIDNSNYIYGNMDPNTTSAKYQGFTNNDLITNQVDIAFNTGYNPNLAIVVPVADFQARYGTPDGANGAYVKNPAAAAMTPIYYLGSLYGYKYTPGYFTAGGQLFTKKISGNQVLSDPSDFGNSHTLLWFGDVAWTLGADSTFTAKTYFERVETEKISSYGYSEYSSSYIIEEKLIMDQHLKLFEVPVNLSYGVEADFSSVDELADFSVEPFNRRDVTNPVIVNQSIVLAGPQLNWEFGDGDQNELVQFAGFTQADLKLTHFLDAFLGVRAEHAQFVIGTPEQLAVKAVGNGGSRNYCNFSGSPVLKLTDMISLYGNAQVGTVFNPSNDGGVNSGSDNFNQAQLYEGGVKFSFLGGKLYSTVDYYQWSRVSLADTVAGVQYDNLKAKGAEFEFSWTVRPGITITGSYGAEQTIYRGNMPFTTTPFTPEDVALYSGSIEYGPFGESASGSRYANNPHGLRSGFPQENANLFAEIDLTHGFGVGVGPTYTSSFWNDEEHTLKLPDAFVWDGNVFYRSKRIEVFLRMQNFTNEKYFYGSSFADTMLMTKAQPMETSISLKLKF